MGFRAAHPRGRRALARLSTLFLAIALAVLQPLALRPAQAAEGDFGYRGHHFTGIGTEVTGAKPQSRLWWADGIWWAVMWDETQNGNFIYRLDLTTQRWSNTGTKLDIRATTRADVLWDGTKLYVASQLFSTLGQNVTTASQYARLYRLSYDPAADRYTLDAGFPVNINTAKSESLVIDKDSTGRLWATWVQDARVYVNASTTSDAVWGTPFVLPVSGATNLTNDDISSVVAFGGNRIGIMWSHQNDSAMYFAEHVDGAPEGEWQQSRTALQGPGNADDHINLKSLQAGAGGQVYAAVKTSHTTGSAPLIMLLVRDPATGDWTSHVFGQVRDHHTRPIVMLDDVNRTIYMFATADETGGTIYMKSSPMDPISFAPGLGTPFIRDATSPDMNDATSTKQTVNPSTGLVVLASDDTTDYYWHNYLSLGAPSPTPPTAEFSGTPLSGTAPLTVQFTDESTGNPAEWSWNFGDGSAASTEQDPSHIYTEPGTYTVTLEAKNADGTDTETKTNYVTVSPRTPPTAEFSGNPLSGTAPLTVNFTDQSTGNPTSWSWDFGDGATSSDQHPSHAYTTAGTYTVSLTATNADGQDIETKTGYVTVSPPPAPTADFSGTPRSGTAPLTVTFTDQSTGAPTSWAWKFGDGATSTEQHPTHTYAAPGRYTVELTAGNAGGSTTRTQAEYVVVGSRVVATASADAFVRQQQETTNFGTRSDLRVRNQSKDTYRSYLSFSVSGLSGTVSSARLRLWVNASGTDGGSVFRVTQTWGERTITWNNQPTRATTPIGQAGAVTAGTWVEVPLPPGTFSSGNGTYSFALVSASTTSSLVQYASRETATAPQLVVEMSPP